MQKQRCTTFNNNLGIGPPAQGLFHKFCTTFNTNLGICTPAQGLFHKFCTPFNKNLGIGPPAQSIFNLMEVFHKSMCRCFKEQELNKYTTPILIIVTLHTIILKIFHVKYPR